MVNIKLNINVNIYTAETTLVKGMFRFRQLKQFSQCQVKALAVVKHLCTSWEITQSHNVKANLHTHLPPWPPCGFNVKRPPVEYIIWFTSCSFHQILRDPAVCSGAVDDTVSELPFIMLLQCRRARVTGGLCKGMGYLFNEITRRAERFSLHSRHWKMFSSCDEIRCRDTFTLLIVVLLLL